MKNILKSGVGLIFIILCSSCRSTQQVYLCENINQINIYNSQNINSGHTVVPSGKNMLIYGKEKKYRKARYNNMSGYVYKPELRSETPLTNTQLVNLYFNQQQGKYIFRKQIASIVMNPVSTGFVAGTEGQKDETDTKDNKKDRVKHPKIKTGTIYRKSKSKDRIKVGVENNLPKFTYSVKSSLGGKDSNKIIYQGDFSSFSFFIYSLLDFADNTILNPGIKAEISGVLMQSAKIKGINYILIQTDKGIVNIPCESIREGVGALSKWCYDNNCLNAGY